MRTEQFDGACGARRVLSPRAEGLLALIFALGLARAAAAQESLGITGTTQTPQVPEGTEQAVVARYWELGRPRWFFATNLELGAVYVRPRFSFGYGQPHWSWLGLETHPDLSSGGYGGYAGLAGTLPGLSARFGARYVVPLERRLLPIKESYSNSDLDREVGPKGRYLSLSGELVGTLPVGAGSAFLLLSGQQVEIFEKGYYVFEDSLRTVMEPPYIWRSRLGYYLSLGARGAIRLGAAAEVIGMPNRGEFVVRGGFLGSVLIDAHLEAQLSLIPVLVSPDSLGLAGGDFSQLGIRLRWATGSTPDPKRVREEFGRSSKERGGRSTESTPR